MDHMNEKGPRDRSTIALQEQWEVNWWTQSLGITKEELEEIVAKVGNSADKVREYLGHTRNRQS